MLRRAAAAPSPAKHTSQEACRLTWGRNGTGRCHTTRTAEDYTDNMDNTQVRAVQSDTVFSGSYVKEAWELGKLMLYQLSYSRSGCCTQ